MECRSFRRPVFQVWLDQSFNSSNHEIEFIMEAIESTSSSFREWMTGYYLDTCANEYAFKEETAKEQHCVEDWFNFGYLVGIRKVE